MSDSDNNSSNRTILKMTHVTRRGWKQDLGLAHSSGGNLQGNYDIWSTPNVCVCVYAVYIGVGCTSVILHTHKRSEWHTSFLAMLVMFFYFIFSTDRVSSPRFSSQKCLTTQLPEQFLAPAAHAAQTLVLCLEVELECSTGFRRHSQRVREQKMPVKPMENLKLPSHCEALPSI